MIYKVIKHVIKYNYSRLYEQITLGYNYRSHNNI